MKDAGSELIVINGMIKGISIQSTIVPFPSAEWAPLPPCKRVGPPPPRMEPLAKRGGQHSLAGEGVGGSQF